MKQLACGCHDALIQFVADRFDLPRAGLTSGDCTARTAHLDRDLADRVAAVFTVCDSARYGGDSARAASHATSADFVSTVRSVLRDLDIHAAKEKS
jgi:hypothetical protein